MTHYQIKKITQSGDPIVRSHQKVREAKLETTEDLLVSSL